LNILFARVISEMPESLLVMYYDRALLAKLSTLPCMWRVDTTGGANK